MDRQTQENEIIALLKQCFDPEIPVNIYELGLIYAIEISGGCNVNIRMTLTSPACPVAGSMPGEIQQKIKSLSWVSEVHIELVWNPPWDSSMMSDAARLELGFF